MGAPPADHLLADAIAALEGHEKGGAMAAAVTEALLERAAARRPEPEDGASSRAAEASGLDEASGRRTSLGDPFELLDREPRDAKEAALLEASVGVGLASRLRDAGLKGAQPLVDELAERLDWLEAQTPVSPYRGLAATLEGELAEATWEAVARALVRDAAEERGGSPAEARRRELLLTARAAALASAPAALRPALAGRLTADLPAGTVKRVALASLAGVDDAEAEASKDASRDPRPAVRAAAAARAPQVQGTLEGRRMGPFARLLAAVTGVLFVKWLVLAAMRVLLRYRREGTVTLAASTLKVEHQVHLLGRVIRSGETNHALRSVRAGAVEARYPYLHLLVGALFLVVGAGAGVNFVVEGSSAGYPPLVLVGLGVVAAGLVLDILLEVVVPARGPVCTLTFDLGKRAVRLRGVDEARAKELAAALDQLLPPPKAAR